MPAVTSGKVLVTGANGYIAVWVVKTFLDQGFSVRGTVRSESKAGHLRKLFKDFGDKFEVVVVEDITKEGAFDEAVKGVDAIAHTASPFHFKVVEPEELVVPAVHGTTGVLASALKNAPSVKRIVITSSVAAVVTPSPNPSTFSEEDWNEDSIVEIKEKGKDASAIAKYRASKTLAERAAWDFWNGHKKEVGWDLVVLNPPLVLGPFLHEVDKPEDLNESVRMFYNSVVKGAMDNNTLANAGACFVDVRDLALAHVLSITKEEASGNRIIINAGAFKWQDFVNAAHKYYPSLPAGNTEYNPAKATHLVMYAQEKQERLLGIKFKTLEETAKDSLDDFKAREWL